jgi:hypothetical protein
MKQSPSWEANISSATQEIPHILWKPKVLYHIHKKYLVRSTQHKALCYVVFSTPLLPRPFASKYHPQHPILENPKPTFLP